MDKLQLTMLMAYVLLISSILVLMIDWKLKGDILALVTNQERENGEPDLGSRLGADILSAANRVSVMDGVEILSDRRATRNGAKPAARKARPARPSPAGSQQVDTDPGGTEGDG